MIGKPIGVLLLSWLASRSRVAVLPAGLGASHMVVLGVVAGVGFTMALFVAQLAIRDAALLSAAKLGVLAASGAAATLALVLGFCLLKAAPIAGAAETADDAECSTEQ